MTSGQLEQTTIRDDEKDRLKNSSEKVIVYTENQLNHKIF